MPAMQPQPVPVRRWRQRLLPFQEGRFRFSVAQFLVALILLFVSFPFYERLHYGMVIASVLMTVVLASAVLAIGGRRRTLMWGILLVVPAIAAQWVRHMMPELHQAYSVVPGGIFVIYVIMQLFSFILRAQKVTSEVLYAAVANYMLIGLLWSFIYRLIADFNPAAFSFSAASAPDSHMMGFNCIYFSFVTLSTIGYGDVVPVSPVARMLSVTEATTGMFYIAILVARLVALHASAAQGTDQK